MGLIKSLLGAAGGTLGDQWKEFIYCDSLDSDILLTKGQKRTTRRTSNKHGEENIISNGSVIAVADGQCMLIVDNGKVAEVCAEPGEFVYDSSTEPSIFSGPLGEGILDTFKNIGKRFTFGGQPAKDQRVYYINTKEIIGNRYGTPNPVPFRVVDNNVGLDIDIAIKCHGEYSYKVTDPILFYTNVSGNVDDYYSREEIDSQLRSELMTALQPAFARISEMGIRYSALPGHTMELADALNNVLSDKWSKLRGLEIYSFGVSSVKASEEDEKMIKELQRNAAFRNPTMAAAQLVGAQSQAMQDAAKNEGAGGAFMGFAGLNMAQGSGGMNAGNLFAMGQNQQNQQMQQAQQNQATTNQNVEQPKKDAWTCECGTTNEGRFCVNCGNKKPETTRGWTCECGTTNEGNFCMNCGSKRPPKAPLYKCDKCGWEHEDPYNPPKFCPECGDRFDENDIK